MWNACISLAICVLCLQEMSVCIHIYGTSKRHWTIFPCPRLVLWNRYYIYLRTHACIAHRFVFASIFFSFYFVFIRYFALSHFSFAHFFFASLVARVLILFCVCLRLPFFGFFVRYFFSPISIASARTHTHSLLFFLWFASCFHLKYSQFAYKY